jgi:hypothetical protein
MLVKWRQASGVLCDPRVPQKLKDESYRTVIQPAIIYGAEYWPTKSRHVNWNAHVTIGLLPHKKRVCPEWWHMSDIRGGTSWGEIYTKLCEMILDISNGDPPVCSGVINGASNDKKGRGRSKVYERSVWREIWKIVLTPRN